MTVTSSHLQACMYAYLQCDQLLTDLTQEPILVSDTNTSVIDECARVCLGTLTAIRNSWPGLEDVLLLCVGVCEECAEICEAHPGQNFKACAAACRQCSTAFSQLIMSKA